MEGQNQKNFLVNSFLITILLLLKQLQNCAAGNCKCVKKSAKSSSFNSISGDYCGVEEVGDYRLHLRSLFLRIYCRKKK